MNMSLHSLPASVCCAITALLIEAKTCAADWEKKKLLHWSYRLFQEKLANFSWQIDCCLPNVNARSMVASRLPKNSKSMEIRQREKEGRNWGGGRIIGTFASAQLDEFLCFIYGLFLFLSLLEPVPIERKSLGLKWMRKYGNTRNQQLDSIDQNKQDKVKHMVHSVQCHQ